MQATQLASKAQQATKHFDMMHHRLRGLLNGGIESTMRLERHLQATPIDDVLTDIGPPRQTGRGRLELGRTEDSSRMILKANDTARYLHPNAISQLGNMLGLGGRFLKDQYAGKPWQREAAANLLATHLLNTEKQQTVLLRNVPGQDGPETRAVLTNRYKRIDSQGVLQAFLRICDQRDLVPCDARYDDLTWSISGLAPAVVPIQTPHGEEAIIIGVNMRTSDFGNASQEMSATVLRVKCINGLIVNTASSNRVRIVHRGAQLQGLLQPSEATRQLDSLAAVSRFNDFAETVLTPQFLDRVINPIKEAASRQVDHEEYLKSAVKAKTMTVSQSKQVTQLIDNRENDDLIPHGNVSMWTISQAMSAVANTPGMDLTARRDLQSAAAQIINV